MNKNIDDWMDSCFALHEELTERVLLTTAGECPEGVGKIHPHATIANSYVFIDSAIPLVRKETEIAWNILSYKRLPMPVIPWQEKHKEIGTTEPLDYCDTDGLEIYRVAGIAPAELHYSAFNREAESIPKAMRRGIPPEQKWVAEIPKTILTNCTILGLYSISEDLTYIRGLNDRTKVVGETMICGFTFMFTNESSAEKWRKSRII